MRVVSLPKSSGTLVSRRDTAGFTPVFPGGPTVQCPSACGGSGSPEEGWSPVKNDPQSRKDSSVDSEVANVS